LFPPLRSAFKQIRENLVTVDQLTALGLSKPVFDLLGNFGAIAGQPILLFMEHLDGALYELVGGLVGSAIHVALDYRFQLRLEVKGHRASMANDCTRAAPMGYFTTTFTNLSGTAITLTT
jgi:hypothetical protein